MSLWMSSDGTISVEGERWFGDLHTKEPDRAIGIEGPFSREHFVHDDAEQIQAGATVDFLSWGLLGCHVVRRTEDHPGLCQHRMLGTLFARELFHGHFGDSKVKHFYEVRVTIATAGASLHFSCALELVRGRIWRGDAFWLRRSFRCTMGLVCSSR